MILRRIILSTLLLFTGTFAFSQNFNVQELGKAKLINVSGGASANTVFYSGNATREPFSYFLNGNINFNIANLYNIPLSFSYTNQKFGYDKPVLMNRLSIHPSYKWITAHIGDVSMTFSPYTLSGHQFSGFGVDLTPQGKFKISAMYGRLLKSSEYNSAYPDILPAYKRFGYGFKTAYSLEKINLGLTLFKARDQINSLNNPVPFELDVAPKENAAISFETNFKLFQKLQVSTEYANSSITEDLRVVAGGKAKGVSSLLLGRNSTTTSYNAFKGQLAYPAGKGTLGLGYERIDPNYRTFGGYYFNNDLENITVNATQNLYKDKVSLALNLGLQKDNLEKQKESQMKRLVTSANVDLRPNQKLSLNLNYSNFQSFTNSRNQFDYINQVSNYEYLDTLNFRQVNQNLGLTVNYLLRNDKQLKKAISANFSMQDAVNQQQGKAVAGGASTYYNSALTYSLSYPQKELSFNGSVNNTYGQTDGGTNFIIGPTVGATKLFLDKKLNATASTSYNTSYNNGQKQNDIFNFRLNGSYIYLEKHNFNMSVITLFNKTGTGKNNDLTATLSYTYSFDKIKMRPKREPRTDEDMNLTSILKINLNGKILEGTRDQITAQLKEMQLALNPLPEKESTNLEHLLTLASLTPDDKQFKEKVLDYLEAYNIEAESVKKFNEYLLEAAKKLEIEMKNKDSNLENAYVSALGKVNSHKLHGVSEENNADKAAFKSYQKLMERSNKNRDQLTRHRWMLKEISTLTKLPAAEIQQNPAAVVFSAEQIEEAFKSIKDKKPGPEIIAAIEIKMIPFYHDLALKNANSDEIDLNHIQK
ncbi:outer membrane beta-barrel family protein [Flavobacterium sp. N502540]|uniref:outer membrane beta-barrel family protein n=1 Tax=Flavobacterium sp. N502540 TaxID=2986838 RepID=UPI00222415A6|nr:outer membrane beta-barrel family protein [Flavobacterium sp. N502540]